MIGWVEVKSQLSRGVSWKCQTYWPVSGRMATIEPRNRLSPPPGLRRAEFHGEPLPPPT